LIRIDGIIVLEAPWTHETHERDITRMIMIYGQGIQNGKLCSESFTVSKISSL